MLQLQLISNPAFNKGIAVLKIVILGGNLLLIWSQISFSGDALAQP